MSNILFISHESTRTGAPFVLLHLIHWIKSQTNCKITIISIEGEGDLSKEFADLGDFYVWKKPFPGAPFYLRALNELIFKNQKRILFKAKVKHEDQVIKNLISNQFDLIYANTAISLHLAIYLKTKLGNIPIIAHIHENEFSLKYYFRNSFTQDVVSKINNWVAVSKSTKNNLVETYQIPTNSIKLFHEFIPISKIRKPSVEAALIKKELKCNGDFIVGGSGMMTWRKGIDLFFQLAVKINELRPSNQIKLIWIGLIDEVILAQFDYESKRLGIDSNIIFTGQVSNVADYFQIMDVFALTSREDPFPLVCLEAASLSKPVVCFEDAGGIPEFLENGGGFAVPYSNIDAMAFKIIQLSENPELLKSKGKEAFENVSNYDVNIIAPKIYDYMVQVISN